MSRWTLSIVGDRQQFEPGETARLKTTWPESADPGSVTVRLVWRTSGKGRQDEGSPLEVHLRDLHGQQTAEFDLPLPHGPCSFHGQLISLAWSLELVTEEGAQMTSLPLIIGPGGEPARLMKLP